LRLRARKDSNLRPTD